MVRVNLPPCWTGYNGWGAAAVNVNYCRVAAHLWHAELVKRRRKYFTYSNDRKRSYLTAVC